MHPDQDTLPTWPVETHKDKLFARIKVLEQNLQMMVNTFNVETIDPLAAFIAIEKAQAALAATQSGRGEV